MSALENLENTLEALTVVRGRKLAGKVEQVLQTPAADAFQTVACPELALGFDGIAGDRHGGMTRHSSGREPWYPRGTEMCNERQVSILCPDELALVAQRMEIERIEAGWIGGNIVISGIPNLTLLPPRTRLVFENGLVIRVDGDNAPCRIAGKSIAVHYPERDGLDLLFPKMAKRLRGLVGFVEKPGTILNGEPVTAVVPEQWIYPVT